MKGKLYVVFFAVAIATVASLILTFANSSLKSRIERNQKLQEQRAVLDALGIGVPEGASFSEIEGAFKKHAALISREERRGTKIIGLELYRGLDDKGNTLGYAMKIAGPAFWGPVRGYLAFEKDEVTIRGISFYDQEETPGLGGRIEEPAFKNQFVGKKIVDENGNLGIKLTPPKGTMFDPVLVAKKPVNEVDAITGATETSSALQRFVNAQLKTYNEIRTNNDLGKMPEIQSE